MSVKDQQQERLFDFVLDALGDRYCLVEPTNDTSLSFETIDYRIRMLQEECPERAEECGLAALNDPQRSKRIRLILDDMCRHGVLRYRMFRWTVLT